MPDTDNGRVTLAVLSTKMDNVLEKIEQYHRDAEDNAGALRIDAKEREARLRCLENAVSRIQEQQSLAAKVQAIYTTVAAAIAAFLGTR
jgi:hypothetical protein